MIDKSVPLREAALFGCAVMTGVGAVINTARIRSGDSVAVIGSLDVVFGELLGMTPQEIQQCIEAGAIETRDG